ncbi:MAG TPA: hypothetical protein VGQ04_07995 [Chitinophagaceae bacterium]|jgi:hypothetical protein|nr:hypothetical protein [Chitinophagaceae bacterium]
MKPLSKIFTLLFLLGVSSCQAQKMVQKTSDAKKLEINKNQFVGKPLSVLLKEIGPKIETALGSPGTNERAGFFSFYFAPKAEYDKYRSQEKFPLTIKVYIKDSFEWNRKDKTKDSWLNWTKEDEEKYGSLIIADIKVYNEN